MEEFKFTGKEWWREGVRFECTGSGKCCTSHGEYGFVYLSLEDRQRFAKHLKMRTGDFTRKYCEMTGGIWHLKEDPKNPDILVARQSRYRQTVRYRFSRSPLSVLRAK